MFDDRLILLPISGSTELCGTESDDAKCHSPLQQANTYRSRLCQRFENYGRPSQIQDSTAVLYVPRPPKSVASDKVPLFLCFHQMNITSGHYFRYADIGQFCRKGIVEMEKRYPPLEYAVAGFSSLVYSVQVDRRVKEFAFIYYGEALSGLQKQLDRMVIGDEESPFSAIALVLELASVEVRHISLYI